MQKLSKIDVLSYVTGRQKNGFTSDESNTQADAETITELKKALKVFDWDKMENLLDL
jgi:hypothetical protein